MSETDSLPMKITGELTQDPNVCKFHCEWPVVEGWTLTFNDASESKGSPLIDALFGVDGISGIQVAGGTLTLSKSTPRPWPQIAPEIAKAIRSTCQGEEAKPISDAVIEALMAVPMDDVEEAIRTLFETSINPALASHGGFVRLAGIRDRDVLVEMGGGCQGCASARMTMRNGVENAIRRVAPQVRSIIDVTDHDAGENPYYRS
ncbi:MAG TPA: NifU family protein [Kiritimatiellia bacterium]|nr:NifU family protein [Kiritimatiellia bacterium]